MKIFVASLATETNTFSSIRVDLDNFKESFYALPGQHPQTPTLCSAPFIACRNQIPAEGWELIEGTATWAEPAGLVNQQTYELLRDEILEQLKAAMPVQGVILGLHGAMVAQGYDDCEGDILERVREIVGPNTTISAEFDPHCHMTPKRVDNANLMIAFKEVPHLDFLERAEELVALSISHIKGEIKPVMSLYDCRMIEMLPTTIDPMRSFVEKIRQLEEKSEILSISIIHGFMAGDVPEMGTKVLVTTDNNRELGDQLAKDLGQELFTFRGRSRQKYVSPQAGVTEGLASKHKPVVITDVWDNPGGGVAGDSTILLQELINQGAKNVAVGTIWDPIAVRFCMAAGEGAEINLRFGAKVGVGSGDPIDAKVIITKVVKNAVQSFGESIVPLGDSVCITMPGKIDIILNSVRSQSFSPDLFSNLGVDPLSKNILVIKSANHFYKAFAAISDHIIFVDADGPYPCHPREINYQKLKRPIWPISENPHADLT